MYLEVLGSGGAFDASLGNSSFVVWDSESRETGTLVDCGSDVFAKLKAFGYLPKIRRVVVTHFHGDHVGSLDTLIFWNYFVEKRFTEIVCGDRDGLCAFLDSVDPMLLSCVKIRHGDDDIVAYRVDHIEPRARSYAYSFETKEKSLIVSGDTREPFTQHLGLSRLVTGLGGARVTMLHEVTFAPKYGTSVHTHYEDLLSTFPVESRKGIWLYHFSQADVEVRLRGVVEDGFAGLLMPGYLLG